MTQSIWNFFWQLGWFVGTKLTRCWQLKNKNSPSTINIHLLFDVQTESSSMRKREKICKGLWTMAIAIIPLIATATLWTDTNRHLHHCNPKELSEWKVLTTDWLITFSKFANFVYILVFLCCLLCTHLNFPIWLTFLLKDFG